jgi:hypothetical protein
MSSPDEHYRPTGELARSHIRNAVEHLLSHPPVQGKAALDRIIVEVESEYFPTDPKKAEEFFKTGPLARARDALIRNLVIVLSKTLLHESSESNPRHRRLAALNAILGMYTFQVENTLASVLPDLIGTVPDEKWYRVLFLLANLSGSWRFIGDAARVKARSYVEKSPDDQLSRVIPCAVRVSALRDIAMIRLPDVTDKTLARVIAVDSSPEYSELAISRFEKASSFRNSEMLLELVVMPLAKFLDKSHLERICEAFGANSQIAYAVKIPNLLLELFQKTSALAPDTKSAWELVYQKMIEEQNSITTGAGLQRELRNSYGFPVTPEEVGF